MICDKCFHSVVCKYADQDYDLEECGEFISRDVVEVKHGEWIKSNPLTDTFECSLCGMQIPVPEMCSPFCPLCGADMRGEIK